MNKLKKYRYCW